MKSKQVDSTRIEIKAIVDDTSDEEYHINVKDHVFSINKGYFMSTPYKGFDALVETILRAYNAYSDRKV